MFKFGCSKIITSELQSFLVFERLTGEQYGCKESLLTPDVQRNARVNQWNKSIKAFVLILTSATRRMNDWSSVRAKI